MNFIRRTTEWLSREYRFFSKSRFKFELAKDLPAFVPERKIFIIADNNQPDSLVFRCPCGCNSVVFLNLLEDAKPCWKYRITKRGNISIFPSIWRKVGCKSHFIIKEGWVYWI